MSGARSNTTRSIFRSVESSEIPPRERAVSRAQWNGWCSASEVRTNPRCSTTKVAMSRAILTRGEVRRRNDETILFVVLEATATGHGDFSCRVEFTPPVHIAVDIVGIDAEQAKDLAESYVAALFPGEDVHFQR
jgi:hypothetical protein